MNLDLVMALVARSVPAGAAAEQVAPQVRTMLLGGLGGAPIPGLAPDEAEALVDWLQAEFGTCDDPAGALYQATLGWAFTRDSQGGWLAERERQAHRATGAYYTQEAVVRYMLQRARVYQPSPGSVMDPACGSGAFLRAARQAYAGQPVRLVGLDADATALELCRANVPESELHLADALLDPVSESFDLCLGNPPYISSGLRGAVHHDAERLRLLRERFKQTAQYKLNTYPLFLERGLDLLCEGGVLGYIIPDSFLSGRYFAATRRMLLSHTILELTLLCEDFWEHGHVGHSVILFVRKGLAPPGRRTLAKVCRTVSDLATTQGTLLDPKADLVWGPLQRFRLVSGPADMAFMRAMESASGVVPLGDLVESYSGLIARRGQRSLLRSANPDLPGPWGRLLRSGREIDRFRLDWAGEEVCLDRSLIKSGGYLSHYQHPKLLLRQTADSLRAVYDDQGYFCLNNIHLLIPRAPAVPLRAVLGMVNSTALNRYYRAVTMEAGRLYAQVDLDLLESLPVPLLNPEAAAELSTLVQRRENAAPGEAATAEAAIDRLVVRQYGLD